MDFCKSYCGLIMVRLRITKDYACIDKYTSEIKKRGTQSECDEYFKEYVNKIANKD